MSIQINRCNHQAVTDFVMIDDDKLMLRMISRRLRGVEYNAKFFHDEEAARDYLLDNRTNVLVVDYNMPRFSGLEMLEELATKNPGAADRIYLSSSIELPDDARGKAKTLGVRTVVKEVYRDLDRLVDMLELRQTATV